MAKTILDSIRTITERVLQRDDVPVANSDVAVVADAVAQKVAPVVKNATNTEPWYKSRIYLGLLAAGLGIVLRPLGLVISGDDLNTIITVGSELMTAGGTLFALYGRIVGSTKPPLGG